MRLFGTDCTNCLVFELSKVGSTPLECENSSKPSSRGFAGHTWFWAYTTEIHGNSCTQAAVHYHFWVIRGVGGRPSVHVSDHLPFHTLAVKEPDVSVK